MDIGISFFIHSVEIILFLTFSRVIGNLKEKWQNLTSKCFLAILCLSVEYATKEVSWLSFTVKTLLLSGVTELVSIGNISCLSRH